jgi:hypothetical protein
MRAIAGMTGQGGLAQLGTPPPFSVRVRCPPAFLACPCLGTLWVCSMGLLALCSDSGVSSGLENEQEMGYRTRMDSSGAALLPLLLQDRLTLDDDW